MLHYALLLHLQDDLQIVSSPPEYSQPGRGTISDEVGKVKKLIPS